MKIPIYPARDDGAAGLIFCLEVDHADLTQTFSARIRLTGEDQLAMSRRVPTRIRVG
jgi:hypothetical protein